MQLIEYEIVYALVKLIQVYMNVRGIKCFAVVHSAHEGLPLLTSIDFNNRMGIFVSKI